MRAPDSEPFDNDRTTEWEQKIRVAVRQHTFELTTIGSENTLMTQRDEYRSLYLSYLEYCNEHNLDGMASFYTSTIKVNDVPMDPAAVTAQFAPLISAFPDWHWEMMLGVCHD